MSSIDIKNGWISTSTRYTLYVYFLCQQSDKLCFAFFLLAFRVNCEQLDKRFNTKILKVVYHTWHILFNFVHILMLKCRSSRDVLVLRMGAQFPVVTSPWRLNFVPWRKKFCVLNMARAAFILTAAGILTYLSPVIVTVMVMLVSTLS
jgi:hypothetical protein